MLAAVLAVLAALLAVLAVLIAVIIAAEIITQIPASKLFELQLANMCKVIGCLMHIKIYL